MQELIHHWIISSYRHHYAKNFGPTTYDLWREARGQNTPAEHQSQASVMVSQWFWRFWMRFLSGRFPGRELTWHPTWNNPEIQGANYFILFLFFWYGDMSGSHFLDGIKVDACCWQFWGISPIVHCLGSKYNDICFSNFSLFLQFVSSNCRSSSCAKWRLLVEDVDMHCCIRESTPAFEIS